MFKKSLLALTVATAATGAHAGTVFSDSTDAVEATIVAAIEAVDNTATGNDGAIGDGDGHCNDAATALGYAVDVNGATPANAGADTITFVAGQTTSGRVVFTANDACKLFAPSTGAANAAVSATEAAAGTVVISADINPGLGGFREEDTLTITLTGAAIDVARTTSPVLKTLATDADLQGAGTPSFGLLDITADTIRFTIANQGGNGDVANFELLELSGIVLDSSGLSSDTNVGVEYFAQNTSGTVFDTTPAATVHEFSPAFTAGIDLAWNGVIDVQENRVQFTNAASATVDFGGGNPLTEGVDTVDDSVLTDTLVVSLTNNIAGGGVGPTPASVDLTFTGDFAWLSAAADLAGDENGTTTNAEVSSYLTAGWHTPAQANAGADDITGTFATLNEEATELTTRVTVTGGGANGAGVDSQHIFRFPVQGSAVMGAPTLQVQEFEVSAQVNDVTASPNTIVMTAATGADAGAWTLNGSVVEVPYLPFGPNTQPIIRHTNDGSQTGDISLRYMQEGVHTAYQDAGVIVTGATPGVRNLLTETTNALVAAGLDPSVSGFKVALEYTTNVPGDDVKMTVGAAFSNQTDRDRLTIGVLSSESNL